MKKKETPKEEKAVTEPVAEPVAIAVADDINNDFIIGDNFNFLPKNLGHFETMEDAMQKLSAAGLFATAEGTGANRYLTEDEITDIRANMTKIVEEERIDAARERDAALAFETKMKDEIKRRKEQTQAVLDEIDGRMMEYAQQVKDNRKNVSLTAADTIRISVSDKNLYYHFKDGALVLAYVGYASNDDMSGLFFQAEVNEKSMRDIFGIADFNKEKTFDMLQIADLADEDLIGRQMICDAERTVFEDFVDEDSGTVRTRKRTEHFGLKEFPATITDKTVEALRNGGYKTILVAKKDSETGDEHSDQ